MTDWLDEQALTVRLQTADGTWPSLDERGRWLAGRQVAEWTFECGRAKHGKDFDAILERRWHTPGEVRKLLERFALGIAPEGLPDGVAMFLASRYTETERQLERFAACWRQLRANRPYRLQALTDAELEQHGRAFGKWFAARCADAGVSPAETARLLEYGSTGGLLQDPDDDAEGGDPEARWFWAVRHCKTPEVAVRFRAGVLTAPEV
ncbi:hypothetical protein ACIBEA_39780 [Streptomyces sp. NPDC051555]|uniref:hypothetical protein n=1 Tax=Streptomyces sp. NPDC051555 TaxID=3365657 RepID=UPI0037BCB2D5